MKKILIILAILVSIILSIGIYKFNFTNNDIYINNGEQINSHDATYILNGQKIILKNGISEVEAAPGSASKIVTKYFGNDLKHDINDDGTVDDIFLVTQETSGSGVFYYVVALISTPLGLVGSNGVLLGDRITTQAINIDEGKTTNGTNRQNVIIVNYEDRKHEESFTVAPSVEKSIWLKLDLKTMQFGEVAQNFEGETDSNDMTLTMKKWEWMKTLYSDNKLIIPLKQNKFSITFKNNNTFYTTTDCNSMSGEYTTNDNIINFSKMISTQMYCEGSQETDFTKMLNETQSYLFTSKGELIFNLKFDSGSIFFK
ncbi:MAG: META domain-containing protein [Candidatus Nomurabacteria bacterium]|nr:META domain-containing protein [Candidatus Nomurabacteria bacterium]